MQEKNSLIIVAAITALLAGLWLGFLTEKTDEQNPPQINGTLLPEPRMLQPFELVDQNSQIFSNASLAGHWSLLFFGYTHCPDICPATLTTLQQTIELMRQQNIEAPRIIFISVDPERDTPELVGTYVQYFNPEFLGLTGSETELARLGKELGVYYKKAAGASGDMAKKDYLMDHSAAMMLINPRGELQAYFTAPHIPSQIIESYTRSVGFYK